MQLATDHLHAKLLASVLATPPRPDTLADLHAIIARTGEQLRRARRSRDVPRIALLEERRRRCERAVEEMLSGV